MPGEQNGKTLEGESIFTLYNFGNKQVIGVHKGIL